MKKNDNNERKDFLRSSLGTIQSSVCISEQHHCVSLLFLYIVVLKFGGFLLADFMSRSRYLNF